MPLRALPRVFVPGVSGEEPIELPEEELTKLRKVLRLSSGASLAVLPGDGRLLRCTLQGREAIPEETLYPGTEPVLRLTLAQALPRLDKLEHLIRACTEIGVARFELFPSDRTVVRWEPKKLDQKLRRLESIAREAAEVCFRTHLPEIVYRESFDAVLKASPEARVLSEREDERGAMPAFQGDALTLAIGPEGGWSPREVEKIGDRGVTLGPRVLRVDTAAIAAASLALLAPRI